MAPVNEAVWCRPLGNRHIPGPLSLRTLPSERDEVRVNPRARLLRTCRARTLEARSGTAGVHTDGRDVSRPCRTCMVLISSLGSKQKNRFKNNIDLAEQLEVPASNVNVHRLLGETVRLDSLGGTRA